MKEISEKYNLEWPQNSQVHLTTTLDSFLSNPVSMSQSFLFLGSSNLSSDSLKTIETFAGKIVGSNFSGNADVVIFDAALSEDGVEGIREVLNLASLMPVASNRKVVLMLNMHLASTQMLNALLKTLEEPPTHAVFLLVSESPLLSTIMSRCQIFSLHRGEDGITSESGQINSEELTNALQLLNSHRTAGETERMVLVNELAGLEDELLPQLLQKWLNLQVAELKTTPEKFTAVRATTEAIISLRSSFNKKMVLQQFVTSGLR